MQLFLLLLTLGLATAGSITQCNQCANATEVNTPGYITEYTQCTFDTTFTVRQKLSGVSKPWLFFGMACDDRCSMEGIGEGYLCSSNSATGYYEVEDGKLGNPVVKYEFHHYNCTITPEEISLHVHRFLPNFWMKNLTIPYYISSGTVGNFSIVETAKFVIKY